MTACLRRLLSMVLCLLLLMLPARSEGLRFDLRFSLDPGQCPQDYRQLIGGLALLLEAAALEGSVVTSGDSFQMDAALQLGTGRDACDASLQLYGVSSHWGVRSSLLGDTELMVNGTALIPFGQKVHSYIGLPLDRWALLVPYTHADALSSVAEMISPLFPEEDAYITRTRADMNDMVRSLRRLCNEDPALRRYLETTGMYYAVLYCCDVFFNISELLLPSLTIRRTGNTLVWTSGMFTLLTMEEQENSISLNFVIPTLLSASATLRQHNGALSGSAQLNTDVMTAIGSFSVPMQLTETPADMRLRLDVSFSHVPERDIHLHLSGRCGNDEVTLSLLNPDTDMPMLTVSGELAAYEAAPLPAWTPESMTGMNILSANSDSLRALLQEVRWPLMEGVLDLVVAAPAPAVQTLMDYAEDSGLIDLLTDAMSGGTGY